MTETKPRLAVIPGDPNGIGPELLAKLLSEPRSREAADILVIGERAVIEQGCKVAGREVQLRPVKEGSIEWEGEGYPYLETHFITAEEITPAKMTEAGGRSALRTLDKALALAKAGVVQGVLFAPFNKAALIAAGMGHEDELHYMASALGVNDYFCEINVLDGLWTSRVTSHIALKDVAPNISKKGILQAVKLIDSALKETGLAKPRIAVCALNPHGGDNGNFGREEIDIVAPAVEEAKAINAEITGPWPADTIFLKAKAGEVDAVVTLYHDQGQIAMKLMGFDRGVTVQGGLPIPVATPAHGTAFDITGKGTANVEATRAAFDLLCRMASKRAA
jgi:4-hydroxythreonine-4-phosphate dehydrogenase